MTALASRPQPAPTDPVTTHADAVTLNTTATRDATLALTRLHSSTTGMEPALDRLVDASAARIDRAASMMPADTIERLRDVHRDWVITALDINGIGRWTLVHGAATADNVLLDANGKFVGWAAGDAIGTYAASGSREYDIAAFRTSLILSSGLSNRAAWFVAKGEFDRAYAVDWDLVDRLCLVHIVDCATISAAKNLRWETDTLLNLAGRHAKQIHL